MSVLLVSEIWKVRIFLILIHNENQIQGASKRAWTSWLVAAADYERVDFVAPVMFDIINIEEQLKHHYKSLGGWTNVFQVVEKNDF